jgi:transcriptional regulator
MKQPNILTILSHPRRVPQCRQRRASSLPFAVLSFHSHREWNIDGSPFVSLYRLIPMSDSSLALMMRGTVDLLILRMLQQGPAHGYDVSRWVHERTDAVLAVEDAALYQALHRLEARGWVVSEWGLSDNNRRAKFYELTPDGRKQLRAEVSSWKRYAAAMFKAIEST